MAYIKWKLDNSEYITYCGKIQGVILDNKGNIDNLSNPNIVYFGDDLSEKLPLNKVYTTIKMVANGTEYNCSVQTSKINLLTKATGLITNTTITTSSTSVMPAVAEEVDYVIVKINSTTLFEYIPQLYGKTYLPALTVKTPIPIGTISYGNILSGLGHYMPFIIHNDLGAFPMKQVLFMTQPFTFVCDKFAYNYVEKLTQGINGIKAQAWGYVYNNFTQRLYWDKNYKDLKNPTNFYYRFSDNRNSGYNITWKGDVSTNSELTESNCGRVLYTSLLGTSAPFLIRNIFKTLDINQVLDNTTDEKPPSDDSGEDEQPPDDNTPGDKDNSSDDIDFPEPVLNINDFITIYNFKQEQLKLLASNIWNNNFLDNLLKISNFALDCIICFNAYNFDIETETSEHVTIGNVQFDMGAQIIQNTYQTINMGKISIMPYFGDYRDYTNTNIYIYLPFIGMKQLDVEQVQGGNITLKYIVDVLTGECLAMIKVTNNVMNSVTQSFKGKCNYSIPLGGENYSRLNTDITTGILTKSLTGFIGGTISAFERAKQVSIGNNLGGNIALANVLTPYLLFERYDTLSVQNWSTWENWNCYYNRSLGSLTGLTKARTTNLFIPLAQENEIDEIKQLLEQGVVF